MLVDSLSIHIFMVVSLNFSVSCIVVYLGDRRTFENLDKYTMKNNERLANLVLAGIHIYVH